MNEWQGTVPPVEGPVAHISYDIVSSLGAQCSFSGGRCPQRITIARGISFIPKDEVAGGRVFPARLGEWAAAGLFKGLQVLESGLGQVRTLAISSWVILDKLLNLSEPQFLDL